jgi:nucleotide-binding universal stress UspA family protein
MNTVIVPVDFSDTSKNAARYAVKLLTEHNEVEIILYHCFEKETEEENRRDDIEQLKAELLLNRTANITTLIEQGDFLEELERLSRHRQADLIIMGITGRSTLAQVFIGSNALKMAANKFCPVMIIPSNSEYREIKNVMLTSDFKNVVSTTPSAPIKKVLRTFNANLHIVNVNTDHYIALTEEHESEKNRLKEMFAEFNPEFYFLRLFDVEEAISLLASDKNIDLIINVQKDHSLVHKFFKISHTKKLAYQSTIPVMIAHE